MIDKNRFAHRLAPLEETKLSPAELEAVMSEIEDLDRIVAELEEFAVDTPWVSQQTQPSGTKV